MTMPTSITLENQIRAHDERLHELREAIRAAVDEISIHEALIALARNHRLIAAVEELHYEQAQTSQFATEPHAYCTQHGILLPEGVTLNPLDTSGSSARLTAVLRRAGREVYVCWDSKAGFSSSGVPNRVHIFAAQQILTPGQSTSFPTWAAGKNTTLCVRSDPDPGQQGQVNIRAGEQSETASTAPNGDAQCIQRDWAGILISVTCISSTNVVVWTA